MARPLSERLADLSARAKRAEDDVAKAKRDGEEKLRERLHAIKTDTTSRADEVGDDVSSKWSELRNKVRADIDGIKADIDEKRYEHDVKRSEKKADRAEKDAAAAILFAMDAIDYAESAVINALLARGAADQAAV